MNFRRGKSAWRQSRNKVISVSYKTDATKPGDFTANLTVAGLPEITA
jgi:hypothetical protein